MLVAGVGGANSADEGAWAPLFVPIVGPFVAIETLDPTAGALGLLIADGVFQVAGALGIALSFVDRRHKIVKRGALRVAPLTVAGAHGLQTEVSF